MEPIKINKADYVLTGNGSEYGSAALQASVRSPEFSPTNRNARKSSPGKWFGPGQDLDSVKAALSRSYCLKSILVSFNPGFKLPEFEEELHRQMKETGV